jgi:hypothetical protein
MRPGQVLLVVPSLLLGVLLGGCADLLPSSDTAGLPEYGATPSTSAAPSPKAVDAATVGAAAADAQALVRSISLKTADVEAGDRRVKPVTRGDAADDANSRLSGVCGKTFASDEHRVAGHRVQVVGKGESAGSLSRESGDTVVGDVVVYESEKWAARALEEWRAAIADCLTGEDIEIFGVPVRYYSASQRADDRLPVDDNSVATVSTGTESSDTRAWGYQILQRHGSVLTIVSAATGSKPSAADKAEALRLAKIIGRRQARSAG